MKNKIFCIIAIVAIIFCISVPAFAEEFTDASDTFEESTESPEIESEEYTYVDQKEEQEKESDDTDRKTLEEYISNLAPDEVNKLVEILRIGLEKIEVKEGGFWESAFCFVSDHIFAISFILVAIAFVADAVLRKRGNSSLKTVVTVATNNAVEIAQKTESIGKELSARYTENNDVVREYKNSIVDSVSNLSELIQYIKKREEDDETFRKNYSVSFMELSNIICDLIQLSYISQEKKDEIYKRHAEALSNVMGEKQDEE